MSVDRQTPLLLPCDLRDWVREDDMVHFVIEAVEGLPLTEFQVNHRGTGHEQDPPAMMLALLIYCYCNGVFGSRRIEEATYHHVGVRYLTGDTHPDHDTIAKFRRENLAAVHACFVNVLEQAREIGVLKVGTVSVDGTKIRANASKHKNVMYGRAGELIEQLDQEVQGLLEKAEQVDNTDVDEGQRLPEEVTRSEALKAKLKDARERLEQRAEARAQAEKAEYLRKTELQCPGGDRCGGKSVGVARAGRAGAGRQSGTGGECAGYPGTVWPADRGLGRLRLCVRRASGRVGNEFRGAGLCVGGRGSHPAAAAARLPTASSSKRATHRTEMRMASKDARQAPNGRGARDLRAEEANGGTGLWHHQTGDGFPAVPAPWTSEG